MKKLITTSVFAATTLFASTININGGWNLLGAVDNIAPHEVPCAKTAWIFNNSTNTWSLYTRQNMGDGFLTPEQYGYSSIDTITQGRGFWVNADSTGCSVSLSDDNTTTSPSEDIVTSPASLLTWSTFSTGISTDEDDDWFGVFTKSSSTAINIQDWELDYGTWYEDESFDVNYVINSETNLSISGSDGFGADLIIKDTQKIDSINGTSYDNLYVTDLEFHVTDPGSGWNDVWDWDTGDMDTNEELLGAFLSTTYPMWIGGEQNPVTLIGSGTQGDAVSATCQSYDSYGCTNMVKNTNDVVGSWTYSATNGVTITTDDEVNTLSIINTQDGYRVQSIGMDKEGAVWYEKLFTGSDASNTLIEDILNK